MHFNFLKMKKNVKGGIESWKCEVNRFLEMERNRMMEKRGKLHPGNWRYRIIENEGIESGRVAYRLRGMDL